MTNPSFKKEFAKAVSILAVALRENSYTEERGEIYYKKLEKYGRDAVLGAIEKAVETCKFFPVPAELIELMTGGKGGGQDPAVAWQIAMNAIESIGPYSNVKFPDGAIAAAILALGGWVSLCELSYEDIAIQRISAKFAALYAEAVRNGRHNLPGTVKGIVDRDNAAKGLSLEAPTIRAKTAAEIMGQAERPKVLPEATPKPQLSLVANPEESAAIQAEVEAETAALARKMSLVPVPDSVRKMREQEATQKELRRLGGGRAYYETKESKHARRK